MLVGLVVGSFVAAFTYRLPRSVSWVGGRSFCDRCGKKISWFDNIPLVSYLLLLGRCRSCKKKISLRYPLIELTTALGFVAVSYFNYPAYFYFLIPILICIFVIDLEHRFIPDGLVFFGIVLTFFYFILIDKNTIYLNLLSGFIPAFFLLFLHLITRGKGMGLGDVKLAILGGLVLGWPYFVVWLFLSFIIGAVVGIVLIFAKKASFGKKIPFGPYLVISFWLTMICGNWFLAFLR